MSDNLDELNFSEFDNIQLNMSEIESVSKNTYEELPLGEYVCRLKSIVLKATKDTLNPMLTTCFEICEGEYTNRLIFINDVILRKEEANDVTKCSRRAFFAVQRLRSLALIPAEQAKEKIKFDSMSKFALIIKACANKVEGNNNLYVIETDKTKSGYTTHKISVIED